MSRGAIVLEELTLASWRAQGAHWLVIRGND